MQKLITTFFLLLLLNPIGLISSDLDSLYSVWENVNGQYTPDQQTDALINYGMIIKDSYPDSAINLFKKGIVLANESNNPYNAAFLTSKIGGAYYVKGVYDKSLEYFTEGLKLWRKMESDKGTIRGYNNVALIYHMFGEDSIALLNHKLSIKLCKKVGDTAMLALNYLNMSVIYNDIEMFDSAMNYIDISMEIFDKINREDLVMKLRILKGHVYLNMDNYSEAIQHFNIVLNNKEYKNPWERCYALVGLADAERKSGRIEKSIESGLKGLELAKQINALWDIMYSSNVLAESYYKMGDFKNAFEYMEIAKRYNDSILNEKTKTRINYLQLKQKDFEYQLLQEKHRQQQENISRKNTQLTMMVITVLVILTIAIILFRFSVVKSKLNEELTEKNKEIANKNKELTQLNKAKDTFLKVIGHDVKGPVGLAVSFTDMLLNNYEEFEDAEIKEYLKLSKNSSLNAIDLLTNLLDWVKSQTHVTSISNEKVNLFDFIEKVATNLNSFSELKNITVVNNVPKDLEYSFDLIMTRIVIRNLITNAIKFTPEGGKIMANALIKNGKLLLSIKDNGIGISDEKLSTLFDAKKSQSTMGTNSEKGIGIGLLLCKDLIEKQGGKIWAESEIDKGSVFYISL